MQREYSGQLNISDNYPKYFLQVDELASGNYEGIKMMHAADFLLFLFEKAGSLYLSHAPAASSFQLVGGKMP